MCSEEPAVRVRKLIADAGTGTAVVHSVPLLRYYRSLNEMYRIAAIHLAQNDLETALKLLVRFSTMLLEQLPKHPDYKTFKGVQKTNAQQKLSQAIERAEELKKAVLIRYTAEHEERLRRIAEGKSDLHEKRLKEKAERPNSLQPAAKTTLPTAPPGDFPISDTHSINIPDLDPGSQDQSADYPNSLNETGRQPRPSDGILASVGPTEKPVYVPFNLMENFLAVAAPNTGRGIETCGMLCGTLMDGRFAITHCVVPKQSGGPDSCDTEREDEVYQFQDKHDLLTVGWIHTHPTQTAFLSSVDLHTHYSYQQLLPEAFAIVLSPKFDQTGVFNLTQDGLSQIESCRQSGFHPHQKDPPLFQTADHVKFSSANIIMTDLRT